MMSNAKLKERFGALLKKYMRRRRIRQLHVAEELGVTPSAVCQMISGKIVMSLRQLEDTAAFLTLAPDEMFEMQSILAKIRTGGDVFRSPFNRMLLALRCQKGMTLRQLCSATGIPVVKLRAFEDDFEAIFTPDDAARLAEVYECSSEELLRNCQNVLPEPVYRGDAGLMDLEAAERGKRHYMSSDSSALIQLEQLLDYKDGENIFEFAERHIKERFEYALPLPCRTVAVRGVSDHFDFGLYGEFILLVSDRTPENYRMMVLGLDHENRFHLLEKNEKGEFVNTLGKRGGKAVHVVCKWYLPIVEMVFRPNLPL